MNLLTLLLVFLKLYISIIQLLVHAKTHPDDINGLRQLKNGFDPASITPGSCLSSWNFSVDPCDHIFSDHFTCGLRCDLIVYSLYRVTEIALDQAGYSGGLAAGAFTLPYLETLDLSYNNLTGPIPASLSNLTLLRRLGLSRNFLTGLIPQSLGSLSRLQEMYLDNNFLEGSIPASFNSLASLTRMELQQNNLTGELPDLSRLENLNYIDLSGNRISGRLPETLPPALFEVSLRNNSFRGYFHIRVAKIPFLQVLDLSYNNLIGAIPSAVFNHRSLQQFTVSHNNFSFLQAPAENAGTKSGLVAIDCSYNLLRGLLPKFLAAMPKLASLSLERNKFTGTIPDEYARKAAFPDPGNAAFKRLLLGGNYLFGLIPGEFLGLKPWAINISLVDNCFHMCPESFYFCRGGSQKSWADCKIFGPMMNK